MCVSVSVCACVYACMCVCVCVYVCVLKPSRVMEAKKVQWEV